MRTLIEIDAEIDELKKLLANVKGTETEVYSRIVGYYRPVDKWNKGQKQAFDERLNFDPVVSLKSFEGKKGKIDERSLEKI